MPMLDANLDPTPDLPAVAPVGSLFASSGLDGPTSSTNDLVGLVFCHRGNDDTDQVGCIELVVGRSSTVTIRIEFVEPVTCTLALNDTVVVGDSRLVAVDRDFWTIDAPGTVITVADATAAAGPAVRVCRRGDRVTVVSLDGADRIRDDVDLDQLVTDRVTAVTRIVDDVVSPGNAHRELAAKCVSVIRVNTLSDDDGRSGAWTTPDRIPHRDMWLWDTAFHSIGLNLIDPGLSARTIVTMVQCAQPDGLIPLAQPLGREPVRLSQPPTLAWAVQQNVMAQRRSNPHLDVAEFLRDVHQPLKAHLAWLTRHRIDPATGLGRWHRTDDPLCRCDESGMDNSSRFDALTAADVDLSVFLAHDLSALAWICTELGDHDGAAAARVQARQLGTAIHTRMWDPDQQFYADLRPDGTFSSVRAVSGFLPLLLDDLPAAHRDGLLAALADPNDFGTTHPVPSLSRRDPDWSTDMWRGPAWVNLNRLVILGLARQGCLTEARQLADSTIAMVEQWYLRFGLVFEFYDSSGEAAPVDCDRKGPHGATYAPSRRIENIRDYHWTAALTLDLLARETDA